MRGYVTGIAAIAFSLIQPNWQDDPQESKPAEVDISLAAVPLADGWRIGLGNTISFCPILACVTQPNSDHQRTSVLVAATTHDDMHSEEQTVAIETVIKTGKMKKWKPNTSFSVGDDVAFSDRRNAVYRVTKSGRSAAEGAGPSGKTQDIQDGSVRWRWINDAAIAAKVGAYVETAVMPGAGSAWGAAFNYHLMPGTEPSFNPGVEFDYSNESGTSCALGVADCTNLRVASGGPNQITTNLAVLSDNPSSYSAMWGIRVSGDHLASEAAVAIDASSKVGLSFGVSKIGGTHHSVATIEDATDSPTALSIGGHKSLAGIVEQSTSLNGLALNGIYAGAQIVGKNFVVGPNGDVSVTSLTGC